MASFYTILIIITARTKLLVFNNRVLNYMQVYNTTELLGIVCIDWLPAFGVAWTKKSRWLGLGTCLQEDLELKWVCHPSSPSFHIYIFMLPPLSKKGGVPSTPCRAYLVFLSCLSFFWCTCEVYQPLCSPLCLHWPLPVNFYDFDVFNMQPHPYFFVLLAVCLFTSLC